MQDGSVPGYELIIKPWWSGGGTARRLVDVLERTHATESEARFVAQRLAAAANRLSVITEAVIEAELEKAQAHLSGSPAPLAREHDGVRCVFEAGVVCPECREYGSDVIHGRLLPPAEVIPRIAEVRDLLIARQEEKVWV